MADTRSEILLYTSEDGETRIDVRLVDETVWLSLTQTADLFKRDKSLISRHISNVYEEGELEREATVANYATVQAKGSRQIQRALVSDFDRSTKALLCAEAGSKRARASN